MAVLFPRFRDGMLPRERRPEVAAVGVTAGLAAGLAAGAAGLIRKLTAAAAGIV